MEDTGPDGITKMLTIRTLDRDGRLECTTIRPIADEEVGAYRSLGSSSANDLAMLLMMARKHCPGFTGRVAGYRVIDLPDGVEIPAGPGQTVTTIEFFERMAS
jgi:hypothetical protein